MGKRQHQKDKMYITCTEYTNFYGGKRAGKLVLRLTWQLKTASRVTVCIRLRLV
uniref:Uncharacterized protein n=1 Tax=Amphilophus citrinellus TaxID=61819 RepID=A0A3Q0RBC4_AMPCI